MMRKITWEQDRTGNCAKRELSSGVYLSPPASRLIVSRLMQELSTVSGSFGAHGLVVFLRMFGMSQFDKTGGTFYGLYSSGQDSGSESTPDYCVRKVVWTSAFRKIDSVIGGLRAQTLFLESFNLDERWKKIIEKIDQANSEELAKYENISEADERDRTDITNFFYASSSSLVLQGEYKSKAMRNRHLEGLFAELEKMYVALESAETILADDDSLRVSYDLDRCSFLFC